MARRSPWMPTSRASRRANTRPAITPDRRDLARLGISLDLYTETTTENHYKRHARLLPAAAGQGLSSSKTRWSRPTARRDSAFCRTATSKARVPTAATPRRAATSATTAGARSIPTQLIAPRCRLCGAHQRHRDSPTEHFFLDLPKFEPRLQAWLQESQEHWRPNALNFALNWLEEGLRPRAITRDLDWGVPVPLPGYEGKRIYVWFDAVIGYFSASIEWAQRQGQPDAWKRWWDILPNGEAPSRSYYFIGKDNIAFHTIFWPAMLLGYGGLALPYDVPANEFMTMGGLKASTSRGNVIWTQDVLDQYGADPLRYYLASTMPEKHDTDFTYDELVRRNNDELVAAYGNAVHRAADLRAAQLRRQGAATRRARRGRRGDASDDAAGAWSRRPRPSRRCICATGSTRRWQSHVRRTATLTSRRRGKRIKTDREGAATTVYTMIQVLNGLKVLFAPYVPFSSQKLHELLGFSGKVARLCLERRRGARWPGAACPDAALCQVRSARHA